MYKAIMITAKMPHPHFKEGENVFAFNCVLLNIGRDLPSVSGYR